ncbi:MAG: large subunit ribosomal protein [Fusobacteriaceae bacterium]|jgi:large subunit ribosomal protein L32|nr:rpmF [Fusobacteriales bacterium]MDN5304681.1 large subunit ribosomal protein [Fusobacteriaceae bacterium]
MAVPKKKTSKAKKNMRRSHHAIKASSLSTCDHCGAPKRPHRVCLECGSYNGKQVLAQAE